MDGMWWLLVVLVVAVVAAVLLLGPMRRRSKLRERFGPEYERAVERSDSRREAEQELKAAADERDGLEIRELSPDSRARWIQEWDGVQARFVDAPGDAVSAADSMLTQVMRERGYPVDDFDQRASLVAVDYPNVVEHYREAHAAHRRHLDSGQGDTEDLRQSFVHYRALFSELVGERDGGRLLDERDRAVGDDRDRAVGDDRDRAVGDDRDRAAVADADPETPPDGTTRPEGVTR